MTIRLARTDDAEAICAIYAPSVLHSVATFDTVPPEADAMRERIRDRLRHYPWLVWETDAGVLAYACAARFRDRAAYDWIAETSIYVHPDSQRRGIARKLYHVLLQTLRLQGICQAVGVITLPGLASVAMHESMGFTPAGVWRQCGYKHGQWWDVGVWQKELQPPSNPPAPWITFGELAGTDTCERLLAAATS